jgi:hypothetical protein
MSLTDACLRSKRLAARALTAARMREANLRSDGGAPLERVDSRRSGMAALLPREGHGNPLEGVCAYAGDMHPDAAGAHASHGGAGVEARAQKREGRMPAAESRAHDG